MRTPWILAAWALALGSAHAQVTSIPVQGPWSLRSEGSERSVPARVPAPWEDALGTDYDGKGVYRCSWTCPEDWHGGGRSLRFEGVATAARVLVDGLEVGTHLGAWTPFEVDVTQVTRPGASHTLEVEVDERVGHNTQGFLPVIQPHFGGIWKPVSAAHRIGPAWDRDRAGLFGSLPAAATGRLEVDVPVRSLAGAVAARRARLTLWDGARACAALDLPVIDDRVVGSLDVRRVRAWAPGEPNLYRVTLELHDADARVLDRMERRVGFRDFRAEGTRLLWNRRPLQVRGMLHWGYVPPHLAPYPPAAVWREQLETMRSLGCNLVKCCLWVPPRAFLDVADEIGMLVWIEYPTWHPQLTAEHREELLREYREFHFYDRNHPSAALRSITCETGHSAELDVVTALFEQCKAMVHDTLVVDDSSWIGWQRIADFYDDHPYGNNRDWPSMLERFGRHLREHKPKPLLFGEAITSDTWVDLEAWDRVHGERGPPWWAPWCLDAQRAFGAWYSGRFGAKALAQLLPESLEDALRNRKYQIERLRMDLPRAGYVMAVHRDFTKARMGFWDDLDRPKWTAEEWAWHGDSMLCLDVPGDRRAFVGGGDLAFAVRLAHAGHRSFRGELELELHLGSGEPIRRWRRELAVAPGEVSAGEDWRPFAGEAGSFPALDAPRRVRLVARTRGSHRIENHWDLWLLPELGPPADLDVRVVDRLTPEDVAWIEAGGAALLRAGPRPGSLRTTSLWYLRGAPFTPEHPAHETVPAALLRELQTFDLEGPCLVPLDHLRDQVDPILGFWESHDLREVRLHGLSFSTRLGRGRLLVSALDHASPAGAWVERKLTEHLVRGPAPRRALDDGTVNALVEQLSARRIPLDAWAFRVDGEGQGLRLGYHHAAPPRDAASWTPMGIGHWEHLGHPQLNGIAWYRAQVDVPAGWAERRTFAVFDGVDDSYHLFVNGRLVARFGDPTTGRTVWLERTHAEVTHYLRPGVNTIAVRVVDHTGAGGIWKPAWLATAPPAAADLVHGPGGD